MHRVLLLARAAPAAAAAARAAATAAKARVGFIGLGNMGANMAANVLKAGHPLVVFDVNAAAVERLAASGALAARSPRQVAEQVDAVVTMLPSSPHTRSVYLSEDGVLAGAQPGALLIDASTIDPTTAREVAAAAGAQGASMVDAPVSGGVPGAKAATLTFMVGGSKEAFDRARPLLQTMGKNVVHCGAPGAGQVVKVCNNLVLGVTMIGLSEAMSIGVHFGMDPALMQQIFSTSSASCWSNNVYNPCPGALPDAPAARAYDGGFASDLMKKDLGLACDAAAQAGLPLQMGSLAHQIYQLLSAHGLGGKDFGAVFKHMQRGLALVDPPPKAASNSS